MSFEGGEWQKISSKYLVIEFVVALFFELVFVAISTVLIVSELWFGWLVLCFSLFLTAVALVLAPRRVRAIGYQLREDDLLFRRGLLFYRVVAVPYGRMQLIDISAGPLSRIFDLCQLAFVTASPATAVSIPGLPRKQAEELRERLVVLAEQRRVGL